MHTALAPITERELRTFARSVLNERARTPCARIVEELCIERGASRVDLALIDDELEAFELKSDFDNFGRLHNQIHAYNRVFDRITLVTGASLSEAALNVLPHWWGIWVVNRLDDGSLSLTKTRDAAVNPRQEVGSLASLLWRDEAAAVLLDETGEAPSRRASRSQLYQFIAERVQLSPLRRHVTRMLLDREANAQFASAAPKVLAASAPSDDWLHLDASCLDFHFPA